MALSIDAAIAAEDGRTVTVACPEWGGDVCLKTMTSAKFDEFEARLTFGKDNPELLAGLRAGYVAACWADADGKRQAITDDQLAKLSEKAPAVIGRLFDAATELNNDVGPAEKN
jgi:hypothetical protein